MFKNFKFLDKNVASAHCTRELSKVKLSFRAGTLAFVLAKSCLKLSGSRKSEKMFLTCKVTVYQFDQIFWVKKRYTPINITTTTLTNRFLIEMNDMIINILCVRLHYSHDDTIELNLNSIAQPLPIKFLIQDFGSKISKFIVENLQIITLHFHD